MAIEDSDTTGQDRRHVGGQVKSVLVWKLSKRRLRL